MRIELDGSPFTRQSISNNAHVQVVWIGGWLVGEAPGAI